MGIAVDKVETGKYLGKLKGFPVAELRGAIDIAESILRDEVNKGVVANCRKIIKSCKAEIKTRCLKLRPGKAGRPALFGTRITIGFCVPQDLLDKVDRARGNETRSSFVRNVLGSYFSEKQ